MKQFVLALTGPTGAGKTTVGDKLAMSFERCVNIDADNIKHMIVSGFYEDSTMPGGGGFTEWGLVGESIGILAANFMSEGYSVIINGYIDEPAWTNIERHVTINHRILLLPELDTVINRDAGRNADDAMGEASVRQHHDTFSNSDYYTNFEMLNTTEQSIDETVAAVRAILI